MKRLHFLLLSFMLFGLTASAQQAAQGNPLETKTFYFDNPDNIMGLSTVVKQVKTFKR